MAKPTEDITWATDATYTADGDAWAGANTKVDPGATRRAEGAEPDTFPAEWYNYHQNALGKHIEYIHDVLDASDDIPTGTDRVVYVDPTQFTLGVSDTGTQREVSRRWFYTFPGSGTESISLADQIPVGSVISRVDVIVEPFSTSIIEADILKRSYTWATPAFSNSVLASDSTTFGASGLQLLTMSGLSIEHSKEDEEILLRITSITAGDIVNAYRITYESYGANQAGGYVTQGSSGTSLVLSKESAGTDKARTPGATLCLNKFVPHGGVLRRVRMLATPGAARFASNRLRFKIIRNTTWNMSGSNIGSETVVDTVTDDGTATQQTLDTAFKTISVSSDEPLYLVIEGGEDDLKADLVFGLEITFNDPGPRNF